MYMCVDNNWISKSNQCVILCHPFATSYTFYDANNRAWITPHKPEPLILTIISHPPDFYLMFVIDIKNLSVGLGLWSTDPRACFLSGSWCWSFIFDGKLGLLFNNSNEILAFRSTDLIRPKDHLILAFWCENHLHSASWDCINMFYWQTIYLNIFVAQFCGR